MIRTEQGYAQIFKIYGKSETEVKEKLQDLLKCGGAVDVPEFPPLCPQPDNTIAPANANAVSFPYILFLMHMSSRMSRIGRGSGFWGGLCWRG